MTVIIINEIFIIKLFKTYLSNKNCDYFLRNARELTFLFCTIAVCLQTETIGGVLFFFGILDQKMCLILNYCECKCGIVIHFKNKFKCV